VETISETVHGVDARRKTIDVLMAIWQHTIKKAPRIRQEALALFPTLSTAEERLWLHYGMALVCYPFFRKCVAAIGQAGRTDEMITRKAIRARIAGEYGHLGALDRSVERIMASLTNWGVLTKGEKNVYKINQRSFSASEPLQTWLLSCALFAHPSAALAFDDLVHLPELFPFNITIGVDVLRRDARFELQRQGGGLEMVRGIE